MHLTSLSLCPLIHPLAKPSHPSLPLPSHFIAIHPSIHPPHISTPPPTGTCTPPCVSIGKNQRLHLFSLEKVTASLFVLCHS
mmetsp:Transcript_29599/g.85722  ORF Transcript_29599/g.85722 Transcript_29599/m.85722 type:complete len:82 (-) Transcript_29599:55-300(-)